VAHDEGEGPVEDASSDNRAVRRGTETPPRHVEDACEASQVPCDRGARLRGIARTICGKSRKSGSMLVREAGQERESPHQG
jgi:hypothetical protein